MATAAGKAGKNVKAAAKSAGQSLEAVPPASPNPMTNLVLTDLLLRTGGQLMRRTVEHALLQTQYDKKKAKNIVKGRTMKQTLISTAIARIATRSVPGAILVGGGALAKMLYDRAQSRRTEKREGNKAVAEQAAAGAEN
jgi:hypothetical protein